VFVHGFNTTFEEALFRNAQIVWDLQYSGISVLYSWSSKGKVRDYVYDRDSADIAQPGFIALLSTLRDLGIEHVDVIAHSMGNRVVLPALSNIADADNPVRVNQLIMAAPDVALQRRQIHANAAQSMRTAADARLLTFMQKRSRSIQPHC
jgi:esterase/lipase superfamily enzyme